MPPRENLWSVFPWIVCFTNTFITLCARLCFRSLAPESLDSDLSKLNDFLQAEKANSINTEALYGDLQRRFFYLKQEWVKQEAERTAMRKALLVAQANGKRLSLQNERLTAVLKDVQREQERLTMAKGQVMQALAGEVNLTDVLNAHASWTNSP